MPLTLGDYGHVGNAPPGPGADLLGDLMNGVQFFDGTRYGISPLDLAILGDVGVPLIDSSQLPTVPSPEVPPGVTNPDAVPEPSSLALFGIVLAGAIGLRARRN